MVIPDSHTQKYAGELFQMSWTERRAFFWHRCSETKKIIHPGQKAMVGTRLFKISFTSKIDKWVTKEGYLLIKLKGKDQYTWQGLDQVGLGVMPSWD